MANKIIETVKKNPKAEAEDKNREELKDKIKNLRF